ncbi:hypothetical protein NEFER03_2029 [Nematocida sp. LUAm3]|nr:hypothetical protein NEFER03_2029 [Nematocida sp. LUAm3]KAI5174503.1 hypothetical protein NEFER02_0624 [Nematocida sp. LUAm2]KAI5179154.1 hypothetical protein NEFER01_2017 [Nematocida sp. LUAm1]
MIRQNTKTLVLLLFVLNAMVQATNKQSSRELSQPKPSPSEHKGYQDKQQSSDRAKEQVPMEINYFGAKTNIGHIYNRGAKKFIGKESWQVLKAYDQEVQAPTLFSIIQGYSDTYGTYSMIAMANENNTVDMGTYRWDDDHYGTMRMDVYGGLSMRHVGLYHTTTTANRVMITPPYYKKDSAFKIKVSKYCFGVDKDDYLVKEDCVDDADGTPTMENDRQLFVFCMKDQSDQCLDTDT